MPKSEKDKMIAGELYNATDPVLVAERLRAHSLCHKLSMFGPSDVVTKRHLLSQLLPAWQDDCFMTAPFFCDYGYNIRIGKRFYANSGCVILDVCPVTIGDDVKFGPLVQVYTATHPTDPEARCAGQEFGKPITIGNRVWIGGGSVICPGVTISDDAVIGAGSVVTKDIPARVVAAGNPCQVLRPV